MFETKYKYLNLRQVEHYNELNAVLKNYEFKRKEKISNGSKTEFEIRLLLKNGDIVISDRETGISFDKYYFSTKDNKYFFEDVSKIRITNYNDSEELYEEIIYSFEFELIFLDDNVDIPIYSIFQNIAKSQFYCKGLMIKLHDKNIYFFFTNTKMNLQQRQFSVNKNHFNIYKETIYLNNYYLLDNGSFEFSPLGIYFRKEDILRIEEILPRKEIT